MASSGLAQCVWCETDVRVDSKVCPECGLQNPVLKSDASDPTEERRRPRSKRMLFGLIAIPFVLSVAYAASGDLLTGGNSPAVVAVAEAEPVVPNFHDSLQRAVWTDGMKSVQAALSNPRFASFDASFISVSEGRIVSFCGSLPGTAGYGGDAGAQRFISIFGQHYSTVLENGDGSFDVLWQRVCASPVKAV